jgi:hypothetical protein
MRAAADRPNMMSRNVTVGLSASTGIVLELGIHALSGRREAWDSIEFWTMGMPLALLVSVGIGIASKQRDWIWTLVVVPAQVMTMMVRTGDIGSLWPLTVALSSLLSLPFVAAAFVGSRLRSPRDRATMPMS